MSMTDSELNEAWAKFTNQSVQAWAEDKIKLDLSVVPESKKIAVASKASAIVAEEFYKGEQQDSHLFYFMVMSVSNRVLMETILTEVVS